MGKSAYEVITDRILEKLKEGVVPWRIPWGIGERTAPRNAVSNRQYSGANTFLLNALGWEDNRFLTYNQTKELGGYIKKGSKGCPVVYWHRKQRNDEEEKDETKAPRYFIRYYTVFNVAQTKGMEIEHSTADEQSDLSDAAKIVASMPSPPIIEHGKTRAAYSPLEDRVEMPYRQRFESEAQYYSSLFHELAHSTGHGSRLNRNTINTSKPMDIQTYAIEELVAEMTSTYLCSQCGLETEVFEPSAAYIGTWCKVLENDHLMVVKAGGQARRAVEYINPAAISKR